MELSAFGIGFGFQQVFYESKIDRNASIAQIVIIPESIINEGGTEYPNGLPKLWISMRLGKKGWIYSAYLRIMSIASITPDSPLCSDCVQTIKWLTTRSRWSFSPTNPSAWQVWHKQLNCKHCSSQGKARHSLQGIVTWQQLQHRISYEDFQSRALESGKYDIPKGVVDDLHRQLDIAGHAVNPSR